MVTACFTGTACFPSAVWIAVWQGKLSAWAGGLIKLSSSELVATGSWLVERLTRHCCCRGGKVECQKGHGLDGSPTMSASVESIPGTFQAAGDSLFGIHIELCR